MPLFQQSVVKKYLNDLDKEILQQRWNLFTAHFHNSTIQQNILNAKEEEYQEGFVRDLFVTVLGYTLNPQPDYNFVLEKKTEADSTKSDGAILHSGKIVGIIELKDTATTDLDKVEKQAFGYKHRHRDCIYVITANFQKLRFYINDAIEYEEFDLFTLTQERFALLYLCLSEQTILKNIPLLIKKASLTQEEAVTKKLYADYSGFRKKLFHNIIELNPQYPKIELFQKTQKLLDRFLFILFAEDRLLVPPNSVREILRQWQQLKEMDAEVPLYERFSKYFGYLNTGHQGKQYEIFAYNGGLFATDEMLDHIKIDDALLYDSCMALSNYDFQTEIDVNILGHIFEHSLNEIEELQAEAKGNAIDKSKTRRKKDGIFYTPRYITKYIVANTVGALCEQKKEELSINEEVFAYRKRKDKKREDLVKLLDDYRHWLLQLTICDPACGSGAFLNQALEYLIAEHRYIDELKANLFGDAFVLTDLDNEILEHNLFGVDINEEAVEIARLSLWLRTAKKDRKLSSLTNHIQCGNSLIDDPAVAGDKAFNWQKAFPTVFENGGLPDEASAKSGFDVVIGNPPYVFTRGNDFDENIKSFIWEKYKHNQGKINLYGVFLELSLTELLKPNGYLGFITPETFIRTSTYAEIRRFLFEQFNIVNIELFGIGVFENVTAETIVMVIEKDYSESNIVEFNKIDKTDDRKYSVLQNSFSETPQNRFLYETSTSDDTLFEKMKEGAIDLGNIVDVRNGVATKAGKKEFISSTKLTDKYKKLLEAPEIFRYGFLWSGNFINYDREALHRPRKEETFLSEKILIQRVSSQLICCYDNERYYTFNSINNLVSITDVFSLKYLICLLNSRLINYLYRRQFSMDATFTITVTKENLDILPIKNISPEAQLPFIAKADIMLATNKELQELKQQLLQLLQSNFPAVQVNKKLEQWPSLSFAEFLKELSKQKIKPALPQQAEWMNYFDQQKTKALALQTVIDTTDKEIDAMVYALYGLSEEEIKIVEDNEKK